jgi:hypothetical protein
MSLDGHPMRSSLQLILLLYQLDLFINFVCLNFDNLSNFAFLIHSPVKLLLFFISVVFLNQCFLFRLKYLISHCFELFSHILISVQFCFGFWQLLQNIRFMCRNDMFIYQKLVMRVNQIKREI